MSRGLVYVATGKQYINEAITSARSVKSAHDNINITLYTDKHSYDIEANLFDNVKLLSSTSYDIGDSVLSPDMIEYDKTLFLDTDTYVCDNLDGGYDLLGKYDVAAVHNPGCRTSEFNSECESIPDAFPQLNTGVLFLLNSKKTKDFLRRWGEKYNTQKNISSVTGNQTAFREVAYTSDVDLWVLPPEYNTRVRYKEAAGSLTGDAKIIHGRHPEGLRTLAQAINNTEGWRVYTQKKYPIQVIDRHPSVLYLLQAILREEYEDYTYRGRLVNSIRKYGVIETIKKIYKML